MTEQEIRDGAPNNHITHYAEYGVSKDISYLRKTNKNTWVLYAYGRKFGISESHALALGEIKPLP